VIPEEREELISWWLDLSPEIPPKLINECIWHSIEAAEGSPMVQNPVPFPTTWRENV
jgi:hypothetical protein